MVKYKYLAFFLVILLSIVSLFLVIDLSQNNKDKEVLQSETQKKNQIQIIQSEETVITEGLTLLERMHTDVDSDGKDESIELYTSAQIGPDNLMMWDDGQQWLLLVRDDNKIFPLFKDYVQLGQLEFFVSVLNTSKITSPANTDLERHIYVINTSHGINMFDYQWDKESSCYKKIIAFEPPHQWDVRVSNKYTSFDPTRIEPIQ